MLYLRYSRHAPLSSTLIALHQLGYRKAVKLSVKIIEK